MSVQPRTPTFPPEVWARVFSNCEADLNGLTHLWTDCRHVSRTFMSEVEALFRSRYLPKVRINFDLGDYYHGGYENGYRVFLNTSFVFDRLASDANTAIFRISRCHEDFIPVVSKRLLSYIRSPLYPEAINRPKHTFELKRHVNDTEVPELAYDPKTRELSFNWRQALSCFFFEERVDESYIKLHVGLIFDISTSPLSNDRTTQTLAPGSSGQAEIQRLKTEQDAGRISEVKGLECLMKFYMKRKDEAQKTARRKRIFRQWKNHGWTEREVLEDEEFEATERAALKALNEIAQFLSILDSSDEENEEKSHNDESSDGSVDDEDHVEEQDDQGSYGSIDDEDQAAGQDDLSREGTEN